MEVHTETDHKPTWLIAILIAILIIIGFAAASGWTALDLANARQLDTLAPEELRHTTEMNAIAEQHARDLAASNLETAIAAENAWRNLYEYVSAALITIAITLALAKVARETTSYITWREVKNNEAKNPAWTPAGPMLSSRNENGREKLLCQLSGMTAYTDDREGMKLLIMARMQVVPTYLETLALAYKEIALEQAKTGHGKKQTFSPPLLGISEML